jgi:hypothetical protein
MAVNLGTSVGGTRGSAALRFEAGTPVAFRFFAMTRIL